MPRPRKHGNGTKREAILSLAGQLLLTESYENISMDALAADAGVSKTTVYAHFSTKLELFKAVLAQSIREFAVDLDQALRGAEGEKPAERLASVVIEILKAATGPQFLACLRVLITESDRRTQLIAGLEEARTDAPDVIGVLAGLLEEEAAANGYGIVDPDRFATMLLWLISSGIQLDMLMSGYRPDAELIESHTRYVVAMFLRGIRPEQGEQHAALPAGYDYPLGRALFREAR